MLVLCAVKDPVNLLSAENILKQDELWDRSFSMFGEKICAMHFKGIKLVDGALQKAELVDKCPVKKFRICELEEK